jgi:hypothetical protein
VNNAPELQRWFGVARHTYAVVDAQALPQIGDMLPAAGLGLTEWSRLQRGGAALEAAQAWCVQLEPAHAFSHWLLAGEGARVEDWGVLAFSDAPFRPVREHLRGLLEAQLPGRERVALRWYKPMLMRALLPLCAPSQLEQVFGPLTAFALPDASGATGGTWLRMLGGALDVQLAAAAPRVAA